MAEGEAQLEGGVGMWAKGHRLLHLIRRDGVCGVITAVARGEELWVHQTVSGQDTFQKMTWRGEGDDLQKPCKVGSCWTGKKGDKASLVLA